MPAFDSYHGDTHNRALGARLGNILPTEVVGIACARCDRKRVFTHKTFAHFRDDMPIAWLKDVLTTQCRAKIEGGLCESELISPDDGCSDAG